MSFDIGGIGSAQGTAQVAVASVTEPAPARASEAETAEDAVEVETMPSAPPPEVMDAISAASGAYDQLQDSGRQLHFAIDGATGRLSVALQDLDGNELGAVTPAQVLAIAGGESA